MTDKVINVDHWEAYWHCPKCAEYTSSIDENVDDNGERFYVKCSDCGHEYEEYDK